jgi:hypothetical protein
MSEEKKSSEHIPKYIYLGGCGFGVCFYIGVHRAMVERWGADYYKKTKIWGGSAGAVMAVFIQLGRSPDLIADDYENLSKYIHEKGIFGVNAVNCFFQDVQRIFSEYEGTVHEIIGDRVQIGHTNFPCNHYWTNKWECDDDLYDAIEASCHIPTYSPLRECNKTPLYVVDGAYGISGEHFRDLDGDDTLFIGIDGAAEVTRDMSYPQMMYPLIGKEYEDVVGDGYRKMMEWNGEKREKTRLRRPNYPTLIVCWILKVFEILFRILSFLVTRVLCCCFYIRNIRAGFRSIPDEVAIETPVGDSFEVDAVELSDDINSLSNPTSPNTGVMYTPSGRRVKKSTSFNTIRVTPSTEDVFSKV